MSGVFAGYDFELSCNDAVVEVFPLQSGDKILGEAHYAELLAQVSLQQVFWFNESYLSSRDTILLSDKRSERPKKIWLFV